VVVGAAASSVVQVRLQAEEVAELRDVMRQLSLATTSDALREGVVPATQEELAAADAEEW